MTEQQTATRYRGRRVAVMVPCHNEELTVGTVIKDFHQPMPEATVHVFDNLSTDGTARIARELGVHVWSVKLKGKGNVVRRMFAVIEFQQTGIVRRFPTLSLVTASMLTGAVSWVCGLILQTVTNVRRELKRFVYLATGAVTAAAR